MKNRKHMLSFKQALAAIALVIALAILGARIRSLDPVRPELLEWPGASTLLGSQFVRTAIDAQMLIGPDRRYVAVIAAQQYWDFAFIAAYGALFWLIGAGMRKNPIELVRWTGWGVLGAAALTVICDIAENIVLLATLSNPDRGTWIRTFSMPKWIFASLAITLASALFMAWPRIPNWLRGIGLVAGALFIAAGLYTLVAVSDAALNLYSKMERDATWISAAMLAAAVFLAAAAAREIAARRGRRAIPARAR
jgi:hypothetical protein